jgi:hypothetical protein
VRLWRFELRPDACAGGGGHAAAPDEDPRHDHQGPLDGHPEEGGCCPPHVRQWASDVVYDKINGLLPGKRLRSAVWPAFTRQLPNPSMYTGANIAQEDYCRPDVFIFWAPEIFWPQ